MCVSKLNSVRELQMAEQLQLYLSKKEENRKLCNRMYT